MSSTASALEATAPALGPWPFRVALAGFVPVWGALIMLAPEGTTERVAGAWPIALAMVAGSLVAGSTPMGGGSVAFPILVLALDRPASLGRSFAFAIQSLGMSFATLWLVGRGRPVAWSLVRPAVLGASIALPLGLVLLTPRASEELVRTSFALAWASFGALALVRHRRLVTQQGIVRRSRSLERGAAGAAGLLGGTLASVTGIGVELFLFVVGVLLLRADLRLAIPTAVCATAATSLIGMAAQLLLAHSDPTRFPLPEGLYASWLAAAPIVVLGAPLGARLAQRLPRALVLGAVAALSLLQLAWTLARVGLTPALLLTASGAGLCFAGIFRALDRAGAAEVTPERDPEAA